MVRFSSFFSFFLCLLSICIIECEIVESAMFIALFRFPFFFLQCVCVHFLWNIFIPYTKWAPQEQKKFASKCCFQFFFSLSLSFVFISCWKSMEVNDSFPVYQRHCKSRIIATNLYWVSMNSIYIFSSHFE